MGESTIKDLSELFLALSDKTRLRLIELMSYGEVSVGFLADSTGESQPKVSRHLAFLRNSGLVSTRRDGKHIFYGIKLPDSESAAKIISVITDKAAVATTVSSDREEHTYADTYINDYKPQEIEIHLL